MRGLNGFPLSPAPPFRAFGADNAPIKVVEFSDFSCPACAAGWISLEEFGKKYPGYVKVEFKHFPLSGIHPWSFDAALYADCAGRQGKFREYTELLFAKQKEWSGSGRAKELLAEYAARVGLDGNALDVCLAAPETAQAVRVDMAEGDRSKINSTPTFFIKGKRFVGPVQLMRQLKYLAITVKPMEV